MSPGNGNMKDSAFISSVYSNWKDGTASFSSHDKTEMQKQTMEVVVTLPRTTKDVNESLSSSHAAEKGINRQCLIRFAENIRYLARQGLALRGDGDESDSNFMQLACLRRDDYCPQFGSQLELKTNKYTI